MAENKRTTLEQLYEASLAKKKTGTGSTKAENLAYIKGLAAQPVASKAEPEKQQDRTWWQDVLHVLEAPVQAVYKTARIDELFSEDTAESLKRDFAGTVSSQLRKTALNQINPFAGIKNLGDALFDPNFKKIYGNEIIEEATDFSNTLQGTNTYDEQDTVNPVAKGIGGFAIDVVSDPLTYVPGALFLKPVRGIGAAGRKAVGLPAKGASKITGKTLDDVKLPVDAVDGTARAADTGAKATPDEVKEFLDDTPVSKVPVNAATKAGNTNEDIAEAISKGIEDAKSLPTPKVPDVPVPSSAAANVDELTLGQKMAPQFKETQTFLAKFAKDLDKAKSAEAKVDVVDKLTDLSKTSMKLPDGTRVGYLTPDEWVLAVGKNYPAGGLPNTPTTIAGLIRSGKFSTTKSLPASVKREITSGYNNFIRQYAADYKKGVVLAVDGRTFLVETLAMPKAKSLKEVSALELFKKRMDRDVKFTEAATAALGPGIIKTINSKMSRKRMDETIKEIGEFLNVGDLDTLKSLNDVSILTQEYLLSKGITDEVIQENYSRIRAQLAGVSPEMVAKAGKETNDDVRRIFEDAGITSDDLLNKADESYTAETFTKKTKRTSEKKGKGYGKQEFQLNQYVSATLLNKLIKAFNPRSAPVVNKSGSINSGVEFYGPERAARVKADVLGKLASVESKLDEAGIPQFVSYNDELIPLRPGQAREVFSEAGKDVADRLMFNDGTSIPNTVLDEAFAYVGSVDVVDDAVLRSILQKTSTYAGKNKIPNNLSPNYKPGEPRIITHDIAKPKEGDGKPRILPEGQSHVKNTGAKKGWWRVTTPEALTDEAVQILKKAQPALRQLVDEGRAKYSARLTVESSALYQNEIEYIYDLFETGGISSLMKGLDESAERIAGKAQSVNAMNTSSQMAAKLVEASIDEPIAEQVARVMPANKQAEKIEKKMRLASPEQQVKEANKPYKEASENLAREQLDEVVPDESLPKVTDGEAELFDTSQVSAMVGAAYQKTLFHKLWYTLSKNFDAKSGINTLWHVQHGAAGTMAHLNMQFNKMMQDFARKYRNPLPSNPNVRVADEAMRMVQQGLRPEDVMTRVGGEQIAEAMVDAQKIWDLIFTTDNASSGLLGSDYFKSGGGVELINAALARFGAGSKTNKLGTSLDLAEEKSILQFDPTSAAEKAALGDRSMYDELVDQVRSWELGDNPLDTLRTIQASFSQALMHGNVSDSLQAYAKKNGLYSATPIKGWYKPTASKQSVVLGQMDPNGYYPVEFLEEVGLLDNFLQESRTLDGAFGEFINKTLDPVLDAWKFGMTIIRPGHHIRNAIGDASITYAAEGVRNSRKASVDATRLLAFKNSVDSRYEITDYMAMLNRLEPRATAKVDDILATVTLKGGKKQQLNLGEIRQIMEEKGLFPSFGVSEDLLGEGTGAFAKVARAVSLQNRFTEAVGGGISQYRDHWARAQHMMQFIRNNAGKYSNVDELYDAAAKRVKKFHPDGSMLSAFESKYMRRAFPFYSWMRGILPGAIEATIAHPGRFMTVPKASYNLAVAMGVDPESLAEPFPTDQLFPSFIREDILGPQFMVGDNYVRSNPGVATIDLANTFGGGIGAGIISSLNPMFKLPFELNSMSRLDTGAKINDLSDYIDSQIPNVGPLSNITGYSPTSIVENMLKGDVGIDQQYQVEKGNKGFLERMLSLGNWATGTGLQNLSQPNLVNYAEIEQRNAAAQKAKEEGN